MLPEAAEVDDAASRSIDGRERRFTSYCKLQEIELTALLSIAILHGLFVISVRFFIGFILHASARYDA